MAEKGVCMIIIMSLFTLKNTGITQNVLFSQTLKKRYWKKGQKLQWCFIRPYFYTLDVKANDQIVLFLTFVSLPTIISLSLISSASYTKILTASVLDTFIRTIKGLCKHHKLASLNYSYGLEQKVLMNSLWTRLTWLSNYRFHIISAE